MSRNVTPILLIIISIGIYFTFTQYKIDELKSIQTVNAQYRQAINDSESLIQARDSVLAIYNQIPIDDQERLEKMVPDNMDNVRLIIDVNAVAARHGLTIKNVKTSGPNDDNQKVKANSAGPYNIATLTFDINSNYPNFVAFLKDLEASLRIIEVSKITVKGNDIGNYDYTVDLKTFWLKQ